MGEDRQAVMATLPSTPFEEVRDFFYLHHNYIEELDEAAEAIAVRMQFPVGQMAPALSAYLKNHHGVKILPDPADEAGPVERIYDPTAKTLRLAENLRPGQYDIELLGQRFGVGFETVCHRLSTLQRQNARGVPFFFIRVDRAGNISKRQSATDFHFSRVGGTCPLWNVYEAFANPGRILTQLARMPDERIYLWIARTVSHGRGGYGAPTKTFAVALGCDVRYADRVVYAQGLNIDPALATPIGMGCKVCERSGCPQRAFPPIGRALNVDETRSYFEPYATSS